MVTYGACAAVANALVWGGLATSRRLWEVAQAQITLESDGGTVDPSLDTLMAEQVEGLQE